MHFNKDTKNRTRKENTQIEIVTVSWFSVAFRLNERNRKKNENRKRKKSKRKVKGTKAATDKGIHSKTDTFITMRKLEIATEIHASNDLILQKYSLIL